MSSNNTCIVAGYFLLISVDFIFAKILTKEYNQNILLINKAVNYDEPKKYLYGKKSNITSSAFKIKAFEENKEKIGNQESYAGEKSWRKV